MRSPVETNSTMPGHGSTSSPPLMLLRKNRRPNDSASTAPIPSATTATCAGRDEPQPKFLPPTITSPGRAFAANVGSRLSRQCLPCSSFGKCEYTARRIWSVSMSSCGNFQTAPVTFMRFSPLETDSYMTETAPHVRELEGNIQSFLTPLLQVFDRAGDPAFDRRRRHAGG